MPMTVDVDRRDAPASGWMTAATRVGGIPAAGELLPPAALAGLPITIWVI
jgi:hypothetical protein